VLDPAHAALGGSLRRAWRILAGILIATVIVGGLAYVVFGVGVEALLDHILTLPSWLIVLLVFLLPALEASAFVGVVFPGEIAVLLGGVAAGRGSVNFAAVLTAACAGAVAGDQVGYWVGHRYGQQLLRRLPDRLLDAERLENARAFVRRTGAKGVVLGRWTAALRALVPGLAGTSHMPYPRFATANVVGGVLWASLVASVGYIAGDSWHRVQSALGSASTALLGLIVVAGVAWHIGRRRRERRRWPAAGKPVGGLDGDHVAGADKPVGTRDVDHVAGGGGRPAGASAADSHAAAVTLAAANPETRAASAATKPTPVVRPRLTGGRLLGPTRPRPPSQPEVSWSSAFPGARSPSYSSHSRALGWPPAPSTRYAPPRMRARASAPAESTRRARCPVAERPTRPG
jgi:undecaprenyl-diphosphatase